VLVMNTLKDKVEKMIGVIEIVLMSNMVFHSLMLLIVYVKMDILGCLTIIIGMKTLLMIEVTVMLTVLSFSKKLILTVDILMVFGMMKSTWNTLKMVESVIDVLMILSLLASSTT